MRRPSVTSLAVVIVASAAVAIPAAQAAAAPAASITPAAAANVFPTTISLPNGFAPEGLAVSGAFAFTGSLVTGTIARINLVNGQVTLLAAGPNKPSTGMKVDNRGRLFVAGGPSGEGRVVSAITGDILATFNFVPAGGGFINDVVITPNAAYFTDSVNPRLYKVPLGKNGSLPAADQVTTIPLTGDFVTTTGFNANGISRTPDGHALIVVQTATGLLFRVDPATGVARTVDLGGELVTNGDGIFLSGRTLFVVQNRDNVVASVRLDADGRHGQVAARTGDPRFDVPTAVGTFGNRLYLVNARFGTPITPDTTYTVNAIHRP